MGFADHDHGNDGADRLGFAVPQRWPEVVGGDLPDRDEGIGSVLDASDDIECPYSDYRYSVHLAPREYEQQLAFYLAALGVR
ncbi:MAG TPA: hypothetical protein VLF43_02340 [Candidatus Saccharimonadales bacterium]|nr:hypothetical protein [Candidatus Saccharimonadales bacterium]